MRSTRVSFLIVSFIFRYIWDCNIIISYSYAEMIRSIPYVLVALMPVGQISLAGKMIFGGLCLSI